MSDEGTTSGLLAGLSNDLANAVETAGVSVVSKIRAVFGALTDSNISIFHPPMTERSCSVHPAGAVRMAGNGGLSRRRSRVDGARMRKSHDGDKRGFGVFPLT